MHSPIAKRRRRILKFIKVHFRYFPRNNGYYLVAIKKVEGHLPWSQIAGKLLGFKHCLTDRDFLVYTEPNFRSRCLSPLFPIPGRQIIIVLLKIFFMGSQTQVG